MATKSFTNHLITDELSYNLSRKYPFGRAFKWWVLGVFTFLMALLTVFNLAVNGFDKDFKYTTDPNTTVTNTHWYNSFVFTWGSNSLTPTCQSLQIPVGYRFITTNLGFQYAISRILVLGAKSKQQRASVSYHNNTLENCEIVKISIRLKKSDASPPKQNQKNFARWSWMESRAFATAQCQITNGDGRFTLEFLVEYTPQIHDNSFIASDDLESHAALWWGARLLNAYFAGIQHTMSGLLPDDYKDTPTYTRANIDFLTRFDERNRSIHDSQLYRLSYIFLRSNGVLDERNFYGRDSESVYNNATFALSRPLTEAFMWNKIFRSVILADLGNTKAENLLTNETLLRYALDPNDDFNRVLGAPLEPASLDNWRWMFAAMPHPANPFKPPISLNESFDTFKNQTGSLETKSASIFAEYICNIPEKRSPLAIVMFTLVANLALFHSAWALFKYVADRQVSWIDKESNWCEGCIDMRKVFQEVEIGESSETLQRSETREGIEMTERGGLCREGKMPKEEQTHREDSLFEEDGAETSISIGGLLRSESSSTQRLIPG